jgi:hypothetical protein
MMMNHRYQFVWESHIGDVQVGEAEVRVTYTCSRGRPATRLEPEEYPEIEIQKVEIYGYSGVWPRGGYSWNDAGYMADEFADYAVNEHYDEMVAEAFESEQAAADDAAENAREW